jgi:hypothetical protein
MKKQLLAACMLMMGVGAIAQQNVGIGTNTPETKLQINGALSFVPAEDNAGASVVIPDNVSAFRLKLSSGGGTTSLSVTTPKEGQIITIYNQDDNDATFYGSTILATNGVGTLCTSIAVGALWHLTQMLGPKVLLAHRGHKVPLDRKVLQVQTVTTVQLALKAPLVHKVL